MKRAANQPGGDLVLYGGVFLKTWTVADAETLIPQHAHVYDHITYLVSGILRVWRDGEMLGDFHAPAVLKMPARALHRFLTLTDGAVFACIHSVGDAEDVEIAEEHSLGELED